MFLNPLLKIKKLFVTFSLCLLTAIAKAQTIPRPNVCLSCVQDTSGGYTSIDDTLTNNPVCNYELLTNAHLILTHLLKIDRDGIKFFPHFMDVEYKKTSYSRGHVVPFEDLAWRNQSAIAFMNLRRNLAKEQKNQNIGTEFASEQKGRALALQYGSEQIWAGTTGSFKTANSIYAPLAYWKVIRTPDDDYIYWMPTHGSCIGFDDLNSCVIPYAVLISRLGFDALTTIKGGKLKWNCLLKEKLKQAFPLQDGSL